MFFTIPKEYLVVMEGPTWNEMTVNNASLVGFSDAAEIEP